MEITTTHTLMTEVWTADVEALETGIAHFKTDRAITNHCQVALFEITHDDHLHVNVTHKYPTKTRSGWAGPARLRRGFVHNRTFIDTQPTQILRRIRDMVFAPRTEHP